MNEEIRQALASDKVIDITTRGRKSGQPRRLEIWFHQLNGRIYITGLPGPRDWYANLLAQPAFTFHLKESIQADLPAKARAITEPAERREVLVVLTNNMGRQDDLVEWLARSPLVEVTFAE